MKINTKLVLYTSRVHESKQETEDTTMPDEKPSLLKEAINLILDDGLSAEKI